MSESSARASTSVRATQHRPSLSVNIANTSPNSIARLVYAGRDPHLYGYKQPTTQDIPQSRVPKLSDPQTDELLKYVEQVGEDVTLDDSIEAPQPDPLDTVPGIFFEENFNLDNPRVFDMVTGSPDANFGPDASFQAPDNAILQERLTWYIDTVELHLLNEISQASATFFSATSQFKAIEESAAQISAQIEDLTLSTKSIQTSIVERGQDALDTSQKLTKASQLIQALDQLSVFVNKLNEAKQRWVDGEIVDCLGLLDGIDALAKGETHAIHKEWGDNWPDPLCDLRRLHALSEHIHQVEDLRVKCGHYYRDKLSEILTKDLAAHLEASRSRGLTLARLGKVLKTPGSKNHSQEAPKYDQSYAQVSPEFRSQVESVIRGAASADSIHAAFAAYRESAATFVKNVVRAQLPARDTDSLSESTNRTGDKSMARALAIRALSPQDGETFVRTLYVELSESLRRLATHHKLLLDITSSVGAPPMDLGDMLESLVSASDSRIYRLIRMRRDQTSALPLERYIRFYSLTGMFMSECESICGLYAPELSTYLAMQTRLFVSTMHQSNMDRLGNFLDAELWKRETVSREAQQLTTEITESSASDPHVWLELWRSVVDHPDISTNISSQQGQNSAQTIFIESEPFIITRSLSKLVSYLGDNLKLLCLLPQLSPDVAANIVEIIKLFYAKTSHLILGAGALKSKAALRYISVRHMSVASESLRFLIVLMPHVKNCIERHLSHDNTAPGLELTEQVSQLMKHQRDIQRKFVCLMNDKIVAYCRQIGQMNWSLVRDPANPYMVGLVKDITTVARIFHETLPKIEMLNIIAEIFEVSKPILLESYTNTRLRSWDEKDNLMKDLKYFKDNVSGIEGSGNVPEILYETVNGFAMPEVDEKSVTPQELLSEQSQVQSPPDIDQENLDANLTIGTDIGNESFVNTSSVFDKDEEVISQSNDTPVSHDQNTESSCQGQAGSTLREPDAEVEQDPESRDVLQDTNIKANGGESLNNVEPKAEAESLDANLNNIRDAPNDTQTSSHINDNEGNASDRNGGEQKVEYENSETRHESESAVDQTQPANDAVSNSEEAEVAIAKQDTEPVPEMKQAEPEMKQAKPEPEVKQAKPEPEVKETQEPESEVEETQVKEVQEPESEAKEAQEPESEVKEVQEPESEAKAQGPGSEVKEAQISEAKEVQEPESEAKEAQEPESEIKEAQEPESEAKAQGPESEAKAQGAEAKQDPDFEPAKDGAKDGSEAAPEPLEKPSATPEETPAGRSSKKKKKSQKKKKKTK